LGEAYGMAKAMPLQNTILALQRFKRVAEKVISAMSGALSG
jgi:hypothetical protein